VSTREGAGARGEAGARGGAGARREAGARQEAGTRGQAGTCQEAGTRDGAQALAARVARLAEELAGMEVDALLVDSLVDLRYLTGFTGSSGVALVFAAGGSAHRFFSDFRYATQSAAEVPALFERDIGASGRDLLEPVAEALAPGGGRLGFDAAHTTVARHERLRELLDARWELVACSGTVERMRAVKEAGEIERIRAACQLADEALRGTLASGLAGRTERDVAIDLETRMRRLGADASSFPTIVASGAHGALPHAQPRDVQIARDVLVTIDWGALHEGYCSDCTRTYASGEGISERAREVYALVLAAQQAGLDALAAGSNGKQVDAVAREVIAQAGEGEHFGHGLGHGVGLEIHEAPRLSRSAGEEPLRAGNVVTVEPGVYLPGLLGVRIEDLVVVAHRAGDGPAEGVLTSLPKALTVVS
jgi:Xaa-Pro aminopeptidase